ncbi:MAG: M56 family metallopeptidase [Actinobacteria bacterium]|nr:M56 family metallopeptidase [Actinomycetota bacterium]
MLLSIPTESLAIRAVIASVVGLLLARCLLAAGLRMPRTRTIAVLVPTAALVTIAVMSWGEAALPSLMLPVEAVNGLPIPVGDGYLRVGPSGWPLLLAAWSIVATIGLVRRAWRIGRTRRIAGEAFAIATTPDARVKNTVRRLAAAMRVPVPPVAVTEECDGGARVVGLRRPLLLVDRRLVEGLDDEELEGLLAHELAHVRRRDNLVSVLVGAARDLAFFVPGGRWVLRRLHAERELAADQLAVELTGRPGALASGLLKVVDRGAPAPACASFAPTSQVTTVELRVRRLIEREAPVGWARRLAENTAVLAALGGAVVAAIGIPASIAGSAPEGRDALAVLYTHARHEPEVAAAPEATAFQVYRSNGFPMTERGVGRDRSTPDDGRDVNPAVLRADAASRVGYSPYRERGLGLRPRARVAMESDLAGRWRATPVVPAQDGGFGVYWLSRLPQPD